MVRNASNPVYKYVMMVKQCDKCSDTDLRIILNYIPSRYASRYFSIRSKQRPGKRRIINTLMKIYEDVREKQIVYVDTDELYRFIMKIPPELLKPLGISILVIYTTGIGKPRPDVYLVKNDPLALLELRKILRYKRRKFKILPYDDDMMKLLEIIL